MTRCIKLLANGERCKNEAEPGSAYCTKHPFSGGGRKVARLGLRREKDMMYFIKEGAVWKVPRKQPGQPKGTQEKVADGGFSQDNNYIYFLDKDGDVSRAARVIGGQKRATKARKAPRSKASKKPPKTKAARKARKPAAKSAKNSPGKKARRLARHR